MLKLKKRSEYTIEYLEPILEKYSQICCIDVDKFVHGKDVRKTNHQRKYEKLSEYIEKLKKYAKHIEICGEKRNSYSKTDNSVTFMRIKRDYM